MAFTTYDTPAEFFGPGYTVDDGDHIITLSTSGTGTEKVSVGAFTTAFATNIFTLNGHDLRVGDIVTVTTSGADLPDGLVGATNYYVKTVINANTFTLSATDGGTELDILDDGTGTHTMWCEPILANLTDAQAIASTAQTLFGILDGLADKYDFIPTADKPTKFNIRKNAYLDPTTGEMIWNFTAQVRTSVGTPVAINS